jgi:serine/threonine protein kinase
MVYLSFVAGFCNNHFDLYFLQEYHGNRKEMRPRMIGTTLAHYEVENCLGEGGSGVVYRARDLRLERQVAIKVLADALRDDELAWGRLLREARLASQLNHPHIAAIYDLGEEDGRAYIAMEYVEGLPLADLIPDGGMSTDPLRRYVEQICGALAYAHQQGVIHGDLKGSNILVTPEGNIKLLDFGLGRRVPRDGMSDLTKAALPLSQDGATAGTLPYLAPEVLRGNPTSRQSDTWALGVLIYQMATGELPFGGATPFELSVEIMVSAPPKLAQLPEPLQSTVRDCLEKDPESRKLQASEISSALAGDWSGVEASAAQPTTAAPAASGTLPNAIPAPRRRKVWMLGAATVFCGLLLGDIYTHHPWALRQAVPAAAPVFSASPSPTVKAVAKIKVTREVKVWANTSSGTYHCPGTRWYGKTQAGEYLTQTEARAKGFHPAGGHACL